MGVLNTTYTFQPTDVITSAKMNNIIDETTFTNDAIVSGNLSLEQVGGKLKVKSSGIGSNELATGAVTTTKITNANVTTAKIADNAVTTAKISDLNITTAKIADNAVTTAKVFDANITTAKIADAGVTAAKLSGAQTGSAPIYGIRAAGEYTLSVPRVITTGLNIASITRTGSGASQITFTSPMPNSNYVVVATLGRGTSGFSRTDTSVAHTLTTSGFTMSEPTDASTRGVSFYVIG
jgi:hypothetical protein